MKSSYQVLIFTCVLCVARASDLSCFGEQCFQVLDGSGSQNLSSASTTCKNNGLMLLEIPSSQVQNRVLEFIRQLSSESLNGKDVILNAARVAKGSDFYWINGNIESGAMVGGGTSPDAAAYQNYGYLHRTDSAGAMYRDSPTVAKGYICEYDASSHGCSYTYNSRCYSSSDTLVGWFDARNRCLQEGGDLAVFDYVESDPGLNDLVRDWTQLTGQYWVGIRSIWWKWNELGTDAKYTNFASGRPNAYANKCLCLASAVQWQQWIDCSCNPAYPFICYKVVPTTPGSTTTLTSSSSFVGGLSSTTTIASSSRSSIDGPFSVSTPTTRTGFETAPETPARTTTQGNNTVPINIGIGIGIGIGCFVLIIIIIIIIVVVLMKRRRKSSKKQDDPYEHPKKAAGIYDDRIYAKINLDKKGQELGQVNNDGYVQLDEIVDKAEKDVKSEGDYNEVIGTEDEPRYHES